MLLLQLFVALSARSLEEEQHSRFLGHKRVRKMLHRSGLGGREEVEAGFVYGAEKLVVKVG